MSVTKLLADDTLILSIVHDPKTMLLSLNEGLLKLSQWAYQGKMSCNPDTSIVQELHQKLYAI